MFIFSSDHMHIKHKEPSTLEGMVPETKHPDSWHTEFLPAKGMSKYKQEQD